VAEKNKQLSAEQKKLQQQLEGYAKQNIEHEEKMHTVLQQLEVVEKQRSGKKPFCC
jgi:flagellar capping protein FliD